MPCLCCNTHSCTHSPSLCCNTHSPTWPSRSKGLVSVATHTQLVRTHLHRTLRAQGGAQPPSTCPRCCRPRRRRSRTARRTHKSAASRQRSGLETVLHGTPLQRKRRVRRGDRNTAEAAPSSATDQQIMCSRKQAGGCSRGGNEGVSNAAFRRTTERGTNRWMRRRTSSCTSRPCGVRLARDLLRARQPVPPRRMRRRVPRPQALQLPQACEIITSDSSRSYVRTS